MKRTVLSLLIAAGFSSLVFLGCAESNDSSAGIERTPPSTETGTPEERKRRMKGDSAPVSNSPDAKKYPGQR